MDFEDVGRGDPLQIAQSLFHFYKEKNKESCKQEIIAELELGGRREDHEKYKLNELLATIVDAEIDKKLEYKFSEIVLSLIKVDETKVDEESIRKLENVKKLPFNHLLTTNYDNVLEDLFGQHLVLTPGRGEELSWNESNDAIIKIHGDTDSPDGIIFTHSQYYKFMHDFGYFRSKLYTLFSSNVVLMMGYGFNDIDIHQTYFQFMRDYSEQVDGDKFYMVLTEYDKEKWGTYFDYYVRFLKTYKINVIETPDLPTFIEELARQVELEKSITSLTSLLEYHSDDATNFTRVLISTVETGEADYYDDRELNVNLLEAFRKIYSGPYILNDEPFNQAIEGTKLTSEIGLDIFDYVIKIVENDSTLVTCDDFVQLVNDSLDFVTWTDEFADIEQRLRRFVGLSTYLSIENKSSSKHIGKLMYEVLEKCHPTKYLYSNRGGRYLMADLHKIPETYLNSYLEYVLTLIDDERDVNSIQRYWIDQVKEISTLSLSTVGNVKKIEECID